MNTNFLDSIKERYSLYRQKINKCASKTTGFCFEIYKQSLSYFQKYKFVFTGIAFIIVVPVIVRLIIWMALSINHAPFQSNDAELLKARDNIKREIGLVDKKLNSKRPRSYFIVINSASNEFVLYKGNEIIKKDKCSTGSYVLLKNGDDQQWMFNTPKGEFRIQGKTTSPVWKKPDWAFVEEGLPVPTANHYSRFEYGVLGDYALSLGHGYLIHGTLYQRFLGLPVTHGCIRLNDENLELVYRSLQVGSKVYIY
ncbi:MAG: L,D-transpeptidase [Bacteroidales bacterium]|nr:L,D-transpeptidase [Bacteroidales bacterium]MBN2818180.1 L,D-transpeptidase [Bacteroidales bacterium]